MLRKLYLELATDLAKKTEKRSLLEHLGDGILIFCMLYCALILFIDYPKEVYWFVGGICFLTLLITGFKTTLKRKRPNKNNFNSFPSGHVALLMMTLIWLVATGEGAIIPAIILIIFMGWQRVAFEHHHLTDVIAGMTLGTIFGITTVLEGFLPGILL